MKESLSFFENDLQIVLEQSHSSETKPINATEMVLKSFQGKNNCLASD